MPNPFTSSLQAGKYAFPIVIYTLADKDTEYSVELTKEDIDSILNFLMLHDENVALTWPFREFNEALYDKLTEEIENFLVSKKIISEIDEYGIVFPMEIGKEADKLRLEI
ncbi:MAG: hypothetical protein MJZ16_07215 [Bacteroidales bacterium]|nr:hypothetical protein [Bacteroidales bacterium]